jgi:hypothetical protein
MRTVFLIRFFRVVPPVPGWMWMAFAVAAIGGGVALTIGRATPASALAPIFFLQMLAASSGFAVPARRGHYDLLLTGGMSRLAIAGAHCTASCIGGIAAWLTIAAGEAIATGGVPATSFASGTVLALIVVSLLSWAITAPLPRLSGGLVWLLLVVTLQAFVPAAFVAPNAFSVVVSPWVLVGTELPEIDPITALPIVVMTTIAAGAACAWIDRADIPLQVAR